MGSDGWKLAKVGCNSVANPNNLRDNDYAYYFYCNPVECIDFFMQQPAFREHMSYAPAMEFNDAEKNIYSEVKSSEWRCNEQVCVLSFVTAMIILTASIAMAAA